MREAYRLQQHRLSVGSDLRFLIGYVYIGPTEPAKFQAIEEKIIASLNYLNTLHAAASHDTSTP